MKKSEVLSAGTALFLMAGREASGKSAGGTEGKRTDFSGKGNPESPDWGVPEMQMACLFSLSESLYTVKNSQ